jgi:hypothetical protein
MKSGRCKPLVVTIQDRRALMKSGRCKPLVVTIQDRRGILEIPQKPTVPRPDIQVYFYLRPDGSDALCFCRIRHDNEKDDQSEEQEMQR